MNLSTTFFLNASGLFDFDLSNMNKITDIHTKEYSSRGIFNIKYGTMVDIFLLLIHPYIFVLFNKLGIC
jgi:hypothetical protein